MENKKNLEKMMKKANRKNFGQMALIAAGVVVVAGLVIGFGYKGTQKLSANQSNQAVQEMTDLNAVASPNVSVDTLVLDSDVFGGRVRNNRSKNIDGYVINWSPLSQSYNWLSHGMIVHNGFLADGVNHEGNGQYAVDAVTKRKVPVFYNPNISKYDMKEVNDSAKVASMKNYVAEVGVTFDKAYSYKEIQKMVPKELLTAWYWMTPASKVDYTLDDSNQLVGINGEEDTGKIRNENWSEFKDSAKRLSTKSYLVGAFRKDVKVAGKAKSLDEAKFSGIILTGKSENFKTLVGKSWVKTASSGATIQRVPAIEPIK
jgi:hypothetical protein